MVQEPKYVGLDGTVPTKKPANKVQKPKAGLSGYVSRLWVWKPLGALPVGFGIIGDEA